MARPDLDACFIESLAYTRLFLLPLPHLSHTTASTLISASASLSLLVPPLMKPVLPTLHLLATTDSRRPCWLLLVVRLLRRMVVTALVLVT
jgi:hypothetical protein